MSDLTKTQVAVLRATDRSWRTRDDIAGRAARQSGWKGALEGLGITLGSLVSRGLLERSRFGGKVHWQLTDKGSAAERSYRNVDVAGGVRPDQPGRR